jgi:hypothetical protein
MTSAPSEEAKKNRRRAVAQLDELLLEGVAPDIYVAEAARRLHRAVGEHADAINAARYNSIGEAMQRTALIDLTLSISKVFERPSKRFPTRSIPAVIDLLQKEAEHLVPRNIPTMLKDLARLPLDTSSLVGLAGAAFVGELAVLLRTACPDADNKDKCALSRSLEGLRWSRDKSIAHNESADSSKFPRVTWKGAEDLLTFAKFFVGAVTIGFLGKAYLTDDGDYVLSAYTGISASQFVRLLRAAGVIGLTQAGSVLADQE